MISRWIEYKEIAISLRKQGQSLKTIHRNLGVPISTLSGWLRDVELSDEHKAQLQKSKEDAWVRARIKASEWHHAQKALRLAAAKKEASETLEKIKINDATLDLAFAMLYFGEGAKSGATSIANSNPIVLRFVLSVLKRNYGIDPTTLRFELHLRSDQDHDEVKGYWSEQLGVPVESFKYVAVDKRSEGKPTYDYYKGVCVVMCGPVAIQRKLMYLYSLFCEKIAASEDMGD